MKLSQRARSVEPFHALAFGQQAAALEAEGHRIVRLGIGEPDFGAPPAVRAAMRDVMDGRPLPYTVALGLPALREAIAGFYRERHGVSVEPARIAITSGASAALLLVTAATTEPGDEVIVADPSYPCNRQLVESFGGRVVALPVTARSRYQLTRGAVDAAWSDHTSAVMIASPSNPTGTSIAFEELAAICALARERDAWRIIDEIYLDLSDDPAPRSALSTDPDALVVNSFSKYFGMTGWRLGWVVLPEVLVPAIEKLAMNYFLCASTPVQHAALAAFTPESLAVCEQRRAELATRRALVLDGLERIGLPVPATPDGAFYVYFDVAATGLTAWEFCARALAETHVALTPGTDFGAHTADTHVRLSYAASREELQEGLARMERFLASLSAGTAAS
jgi:aspartate/methionine/tyrosine aminotransferase